MSLVVQQSPRSLFWELVSESCFCNNLYKKATEENQKRLEMYLVLLLEKFLDGRNGRNILMLYEYLFTCLKDLITTEHSKHYLVQIQLLAETALIRAGIFKRSFHTAGDLKLAQMFYGTLHEGRGGEHFFAPVYEIFSFDIAPYVYVLGDIRDEYIRQPAITTLAMEYKKDPVSKKRNIELLQKRGVKILEHITRDNDDSIQ